ncbi:hypothetical protein GO011_28665 [Mycobacterium sp. 20091114027_K0903767]|nr:hypothetical protein [Mycobacterium sp. 20091114027_K0903767]
MSSDESVFSASQPQLTPSSEPKETELNLALRPYATAGIALVGASVIAVTPIAAPPPTIQTHAVQLSAAVEDPIAVFQPVFDQASALLQTIVNTETQNPTPVLQQWMKNQVESATILAGFAKQVSDSLGAIVQGLPGVLQAAIDKSIAGDPAGALGDLVSGVMLPALPIILGLQNVNLVFQRPIAVFQQLVSAAFTRPTNFLTAMLTAGVPAVQQVIRSVQTVFVAAGSGDPVAVVNAVEHTLADIASANIKMGAAVYSQVGVIRRVLVRAFQTKPPFFPTPTATTALGAGALPAPLTLDLPSIQSIKEQSVAAESEQATSAESAPVTADAPSPADATPATTSATPPVDSSMKPLVRQSLVATPGKSSTSAFNKPTAKVASTVRDGISATVNKIGESVKKAFTQPAKADKGSTAADSSGDAK